jgi:hypothetical protein
MKKYLGRIAASVLSVVLVFCAVAAYAEEQYQAEVSANYSRSDYDFDSRAIMYGVSAEVFFEPVKTTEHPYAEAAFLERIGSAFVFVGNFDSKAGSSEGKGPMLEVGVNYAKPGFPLAIQAMYFTSKQDYGAPFNGTVKSNGYALRVGNYFTNTLLAGVEYMYDKADFSFTGFSMASSNIKDYRLFAKYIYELEHGRELSFEENMGTTKSDDGTKTLSNTDVALAVDYFFSRSLSAGAGIGNNSGKDKNSEGRTYSANIRYFFTPRFSARATYDRFLNANPGLSNDKIVGATLAARF